MDLLGDLGGDPFASSAPPAQTQPIGGGGGEGLFSYIGDNSYVLQKN